jgi:hypothetical protein
MTIDISGLDKGAVLAALWNNAALPPNHAVVHPRTRPMTVDEAHKAFIAEGGHGFDYYQDRILKFHLGADEFDPRWYDRDNGQGLAERVIEHLRVTGSVDKLADA